MKRIAKGLQKFVIDNPEPFIVQVNHTGEQFRGQSIHESIITERNFIIQRLGKISDEDKREKIKRFVKEYLTESNTVPIKDDALEMLHAAYVIQQQGRIGTDARDPINTMTGVNHMGEVVAFLVKYNGNSYGQDINDPLGTVTSKERFGVVEVKGIPYQIVDIGLRMLEPFELYGAQGFPNDYVIDRDIKGNTITKTEQVKRCGNAVCPPIPAALVRENLPELCRSVRLPICRNDRLREGKNGQLRFA